MRETQMRKIQAKQEKDEYEKKLEADIKRYNYFGRSGGGAPMRDKDGNVVANLGDLRNPQQQQQQYQSPRSQQQQYTALDDKVYSLGAGTSSITNAPFYNGGQQQYSSNTVNKYFIESNEIILFFIVKARPGSPNHTRGAVSNGIFGTVKTEEQLMREERYKQDLRKQIDEKRQRNAEELARRRADEERELTKHIEWQQQMEKQMAEEAARKQEKEAQERLHQQQLEEELERQRKQEEITMKRSKNLSTNFFNHIFFLFRTKTTRQNNIIK
jgi:centrosome and spindle pole-associated protein 1